MYGLPFSTKMPSFLFERNTAWEEERKKLGIPKARGKKQPQQKGRKQSKAVREEMKGLPFPPLPWSLLPHPALIHV